MIFPAGRMQIKRGAARQIMRKSARGQNDSLPRPDACHGILAKDNGPCHAILVDQQLRCWRGEPERRPEVCRAFAQAGSKGIAIDQAHTSPEAQSIEAMCEHAAQDEQGRTRRAAGAAEVLQFRTRANVHSRQHQGAQRGGEPGQERTKIACVEGWGGQRPATCPAARSPGMVIGKRGDQVQPKAGPPLVKSKHLGASLQKGPGLGFIQRRTGFVAQAGQDIFLAVIASR